MRYPSRLLTNDETVLHQFRAHWRVLLPTLGWAMLFAAIVGMVLAGTEDSRWWVLSSGLAVAAWFVLSIRTLLTWWFTAYVLTTERIIVRSGIIARAGTEIPLESITNVRFSQRVFERMLGYGDLLVESAGSMSQSRLDDIPDPEAFQSEIYRARETRTLALKRQVGEVPVSSARDVVAQLEALAHLRERGHVTEAEFQTKKARLLDQAITADRDAPPEAIGRSER